VSISYHRKNRKEKTTPFGVSSHGKSSMILGCPVTSCHT